MIKTLSITLIILFGCSHLAFCQQSHAPKNLYGLSAQDIQWMREATKQQLGGCRVRGASDTWLHTPDGIGNYKALWTRDFYYMVEYAGDLMNQNEIKASIHYLINGQREDGCIPDRVNIQGNPVYSPGPEQKPMADHAMDNGPFMALLVCSYVNQFGDEALFREVEEKLKKGLDFINRDETGLVFNDPVNPQCPYGFTDTVLKTGHLLFSSILYYHACIEMQKLCKKFNIGDPSIYRKRAELIKKNIKTLKDKQSGMYLAADIDCKQIDIWGSAYAAHVGLTNKAESKSISTYLINNKDQIFMNGQIRHLPGSDSGWDELFIEIKEGTYQNGAYWATPLAWVIPVIAQQDHELASQILRDVIKDFQENGINECINTGYVNIPNYVASATNVYSLTVNGK
ncbi:MAG: hypothetical protein RIC06_01040 [Cyclobacteriaceae bacterium]